MTKIFILVFLVTQGHCVQNCLRWSESESYDDCQQIALRNGISVLDLRKMNSGLNCDNLQNKHPVCTSVSYDSNLRTKSINCIEKRAVEEASTCMELARQSSITIDEFKLLNLNLNCDKGSIIAGVDVCFKGSDSINCADVQQNSFENTCDHFMRKYNLSRRELLLLNPYFDCKMLQKNGEICVGRGPFKYSECIETLRISTEINTCTKLSQKIKLPVAHIEAMNPAIDCSSELAVSSLVCIQSLGMDTQKAQQLLIESLSVHDETLSRAYQNYIETPNSETRNQMSEQISNSIRKPDVTHQLKELYRRSVDIRKILDFQHPLPKEEYCQQAKDNGKSQEIQNCYCGDEELVIYCQALEHHHLSHRMTRKMTNRPANETVIRSKRSCSTSKRCFGGCAINAPPLVLSFSETPCLDEYKEFDELTDSCQYGSSDCIKVTDLCEGVFATAIEATVDVELNIQLSGGILDSLGTIELDPRLGVVSGKFHEFSGILTFSKSFFGKSGKLSIDFDQKLTEVRKHNICQFPTHKTNNYCTWRGYHSVLQGHVKVEWTGLLNFGSKILFEKQIWSAS